MTTIADLVRVNVDAVRGRTCGACEHGDAGCYQDGLGCRLGYAPASAEDGCSDFKPWEARLRPPMFHGMQTLFHGHTKGQRMMSKPRRGDCGSCHWFECAPQQQNGQRIGQCMVNPPIPAQFPQGNPLNPGQVRMVLQGIRPPVAETDRCKEWWLFGATKTAFVGVPDSAIGDATERGDDDAA